MFDSLFRSLTPVVRDLIIINVLMFFGTYIIMGSEEVIYDSGTGLVERGDLGRLWLASYMPGSENFRPFQIVTHMFMHGDMGHLLFNMFSLFIFGPMVERVWGAKKFLIYYLFCGFGAYLLQTGVRYYELTSAGIDYHTFNGSMLGASGAIFGIYAAFAWLFPNSIIQLLFPPIPMKAKYFVLIMGALEVYLGLQGKATGIAHFAHVGGALFGVLFILLFTNKIQSKW